MTDRTRHKKVKTEADYKTIPLRIDHKTVIFINPGDDPEKKKAEFIERLERCRNNI